MNLKPKEGKNDTEGCGYSVFTALLSPLGFYYNGFVAFTVYNWFLPRCPKVELLEVVGGMLVLSFVNMLFKDFSKHYPDDGKDWSKAWTLYRC